MKVYIVRHGQTDFNKERIVSSTTDIDINHEGELQAMQAQNIMKNKDYDLVICSTLLRTRHTMKIINSKNIPVIFDERIIERGSGVLEGKPYTEESLDEYWNYNIKKEYQGAEPIDSFLQRVYDFLNEIKEKYKNKKVLVVTHNGVARAIECYVNGIPKSGNFRDYSIDNCQIKEYDLV